MTPGAWCLVAYTAIATVPLVRTDLREHRLPNRWTLAGWLVALGAIGIDWMWLGAFPVTMAVAGGVALAVFGLLAAVAGLGMGDVKLAVPLAVGLGSFSMDAVLAAGLLAFVLGGLVALVLLCRGRSRETEIAFGPFLLAGYWICIAGVLLGAAVPAGQLAGLN